MRTNLIMHFHCSECGAVLNIAYPDAAAKPAEYHANQPWARENHDAEPTGAAVRYVPAISVEPCPKCIERHTGPAKQLSAALKAMGALE